MMNTPTKSDQAGTASGQAGTDQSARNNLASHLRLWGVAAVCLAADLGTKYWAFAHLDPHPHPAHVKTVIPHVMTFRRSLNAGALFGLGKGLTPIFILASLLALGFVWFLFIHSTKDRRSLHIGLAMVLAGALGNLYDRTFAVADVVRYTVNDRTYTEAFKLMEATEEGVIVGTWPGGEHPHLIAKQYNPRVHRQGVVRDFIKMEPQFTIAGRNIQIWPWVFNVADVLLVVGVGLLMLNFWWERKAEQARQASSPESAGA